MSIECCSTMKITKYCLKAINYWKSEISRFHTSCCKETNERSDKVIKRHNSACKFDLSKITNHSKRYFQMERCDHRYIESFRRKCLRLKNSFSNNESSETSKFIHWTFRTKRLTTRIWFLDLRRIVFISRSDMKIISYRKWWRSAQLRTFCKEHWCSSC